MVSCQFQSAPAGGAISAIQSAAGSGVETVEKHYTLTTTASGKHIVDSGDWRAKNGVAFLRATTTKADIDDDADNSPNSDVVHGTFIASQGTSDATLVTQSFADGSIALKTDGSDGGKLILVWDDASSPSTWFVYLCVVSFGDADGGATFTAIP